MYKVIIIDDEPWTIVDIEKTFALDKMGFEITASYRTPQKALPSIVKQQPDLVITDIRMPGMTGIELMKKVRAQHIDCEFIIVSGYSDFTYAKDAISCGVTGYCLKPLNPSETEACLNRVKKNLDSRQAMPSAAFTDDHFDKMLNYINTHFSDRLTLRSLAEIFDLNPNYCCSLFSRYLDRTFSQYLTEIRIKEARDLLRNSDYTLEKIADLTGYNDYFYFSKVFKKQSSYSPSEYRKLFGQAREVQQ